MAFDITGQLNLRLASGAIRGVANEINSGLRSSGIGAVNIPVKADSAALANFRNQVNQTGDSVEKFAQQSGLALKRFAAFTLAASPFIAIASGIRTAVSEAFEFDKQMVRLRQVTIEAGSEVGSIAKEVTRLSTTFGVSSQELIKTAVTLKQANLTIEDTRNALEALAKSALAPNFDSMAQTTEGAIAVMNQFKIKGKELEQALGSMNAVAGEFAVEAGDLIEVVRRTGGAFQAAGGNLNELLGLFTSVRQTTRESAESIATGLRTIFTRIQRNDTVNALKEFGVNLRFTREEASRAGNINLANQFVGGYEAIKRISTALNQLSAADPRFSAIVEDLGGYRQISKVIPLIQEFATSERALMVAEAGRVSLTVNAAQAADSYGNRLTKLREIYSEFGRSLLDSSSFKAAFDGFETLAKGLALVLNAAKPLLPMLTALATVKIATNLFGFGRNFYSGATHFTSTPSTQKFAAGGLVPGSGNTDSVPALLAPGSFVLRKSSTQKLMGYANGGEVLDRARSHPRFQEMLSAFAKDKLIKGISAGRISKGLKKVLTKEERKNVLELDIDSEVDKSGHYAWDKKIKIFKGGVDQPNVYLHELVHLLDHQNGMLSTNKFSKTSRDIKKLQKLYSIAEKRKPIKSGNYDFKYFQNPMEILAHLYANEHIRSPRHHNVNDDINNRLRGGEKVVFSTLIKSMIKNFRKEIISNPVVENGKRIQNAYIDSLSKEEDKTIGKKLFDIGRDKKKIKNLQKRFDVMSESGAHSVKVLDFIKNNLQFNKQILNYKIKNIKKPHDFNDSYNFHAHIRETAENLIDKYDDIFDNELINLHSWENYPVNLSIFSGKQKEIKKTYKNNYRGLLPNRNYLLALVKGGVNAIHLNPNKNPYEKKAAGGLVPGTGNTDSVFAPLEKDSFVLRKSAVNSLKKMATGGIVPAMVMPGEYIFSPQEARGIGYDNLSHINSTGSLPGYAKGGRVTPSVKKLATELGLTEEELKSINATQKSGFLNKSDIEKFAAEKTEKAKIIADYEKRKKRKEIIKNYESSTLNLEAENQYDFSSIVNPIYSEKIIDPAAPGTIPDDIGIVRSKKSSGNPRFAKGLSKKEMVRAGKPRQISSSGYESQVFGPASWNMKQEEFPSDLGFKPGDSEARLFAMGREAGRGKAANAAFAAARAPEEAASIVAAEEARLEKERELPRKAGLKEEAKKAQLLARKRAAGRGQISNATFAAARVQEEAAYMAAKEVAAIEKEREIPENAKVIRDSEPGPITLLRDVRKRYTSEQIKNLHMADSWDRALDKSTLSDEDFEKFNIATGQAFDPNAKIIEDKQPRPDTPRRRRNREAANAAAIPRQGISATYTPQLPPVSTVNFTDNPVQMQAQIVQGMMSQLKSAKDPGIRRKIIQNLRDEISNLSKITEINPQELISNNIAETYKLKPQAFESIKKSIKDRLKNKIRAYDKLIDDINLTREDAENNRSIAEERDKKISKVLGSRFDFRLDKNEHFERAYSDKAIIKGEMKSVNSDEAKVHELLKKLNTTAGLDANNKKVSQERQSILNEVNSILGKYGIKNGFNLTGSKYQFKDGVLNTEAGPGKLEAMTGRTLQEIVSGRTQERVSALDPTGKGQNITDAKKQALLDEEIAKVQKEYVDGQARIIMKQKGITSLEEARAILTQQFNEAMKSNILFMENNASTGRTLVTATNFRKNITGDPEQGTLAAEIKNRYEKELARIDPKGKGKNLAESTKQEALIAAENSVRQDAIATFKNQIIEDKKLRDVKAAEALAHEKVIKALDENHQVIVKGNRIMDASMAQSGNEGKRADLINAGNSLKENAGNLFSKQNLMGLIPGVLSYAGYFANESAGPAEAAVSSDNTNSYVAKRTVGGALSGAATGAVGAASAAFFFSGGPANPFSPYIAAIAGLGGAAVGAAKSFKDASLEISDAQVGAALKRTTDALSNFARGTFAITPKNSADIIKNFEIIDKDIANKSLGNTSYGFGLISGSQESFQAELTKNMRENMAGQAAPMMDALTKMIQDQATKNIGDEDLKDNAARRKTFDNLLAQNGGLGSKLFTRIATATGQDPEMFRKSLIDLMQRTQETENLKRRQQAAETDVNRSSANFGSLAVAVEVATQRVARMNASIKNVSDFMDGNISSFTGAGLTESLQRPLGSAREDFMAAVRSITKTAGISGGDVEKTADAISVTGKILPGIINAIRSQPVANFATGADFSVQISESLRKGLASNGVDNNSASMITNMIAGQLGTEDFSKLLKETGQDMGKVIQKLLGPMAEPLKQSFVDIAKNLDERAKMFSDGLSELANRTRAAGELFDKANAAEYAAIRNRIQTGTKNRLIPEDLGDAISFGVGSSVRQARQQRLAGFGGPGAQDPQVIGSALGSIYDEIRQAEERISRATKGGDIGEQNEASLQLTKLKTRAADLSQALKNLTDVSERTSQAQEKLGKIQADREGRQSLGMRYASANAEGRAEIASSFRLLDAAARMGSANSFSVKQQNQIFSLLSSLSPQMRLSGLGGVTVKDLTSQLLKNTFGGAFDVDPQTAALERALDGFVQSNYEVAVEASRMQAEIQQKLQGDFFSKLQATQQTFVNELSRVMQENQNLMRESLQMQAQSRLDNLEKQIGQSSFLGKIGINTDEQFKALSGLLNDPKNKSIETIFEAGKNQKILTARSDEAIGNTDRFVSDIVAVAGNEYARGTARSTTSGILLNKFGEMGFTAPTDQKKLLSLFSERLDQKAGYLSTIGTNRENIAEAFKYAIDTFKNEGVDRTFGDIDKARNDLNENGILSKETIEKIVSGALESGDSVTIKTLRESVNAVNSTNKKFSELNVALDQARQQVQNFANGMNLKPDGKAQGGLIKYFNKGGWGSGGSFTPHNSDTVNARISPNEFVVAAGPAQRNRKLLENINAGYADGGEVQDISKINPENILNPDATLKVIEDAKKNVRLNVEAMFLSQLKNMNSEQRAKFLEEQTGKIDALAGKETNEQLGIKDAIEKIRKIQLGSASNFSSNKLASYQESVTRAAVGFALDNAKFEKETSFGHLGKIREFGERVVNRGFAAKELMDKIDNEFKEKNKKTLKEFIGQNANLSRFKYLADHENLSRSVDQALLKREFGSTAEERRNFGIKYAIQKHIFHGQHPGEAAALDIIHKRYGGDPNALRLEAITEHLDKWYQNTVKGLERNKPSEFVEGVQYEISGAEQKINQLIEDAIKKLNDKKGQVEKNEEIKGNLKKASENRTSAFQTADDGILKILGDRSSKNFNRQQDQQLMQLQLMSMEANAFNRLPPAIQTKLLEQKRSNILNNKLTALEKDQLNKSGLLKAIDNPKDLSADELNGLAGNRTKMTLVQRAALDVLVAKALSGAQEKISKDPDSLSAAEKAAYLINLDAQGQKEALDFVGDRNNAMLISRIGQFITANPGGAQKMLDTAKENGAAAYAKEAALLEIISALFGGSISLPKASEVYKEKSLRSKAQNEAIGKGGVAAAKDAAAIIGAGMNAFGAGIAGAAAAAGLAQPKGPEKTLFGVDDINKKLPAFAVGGLVPGVGNTDSVRANLPVGSYVVRKSSVNKIGAETLASLPHMAYGGVVPAMVMPGEHIFSPKEVSRIGKNNLDHINEKGKLPGYNDGGIVVNGIRYMPVGTEKWGGARGFSSGFQPQTQQGNSNPIAQKPAINQTISESQFSAIQAINESIQGAGGITALKARFFSLRNSMRDPRQRTRENIAELRQMYATLTNPLVVQMDAQRQMLGAQEAFASFQQDPKAFVAKSRELRALAANAKASMEERVAAKEQLNQMSYAARFVDPRILRAAAMPQRKAAQNQQQAQGNDPLQGGLRLLNPAMGDVRPLQFNDNPTNIDRDIKEKREGAISRAEQNQKQNDEINRWHIQEGIKEIRDPGGVKRQAEMLQKFNEEKERKRKEFESKIFAPPGALSLEEREQQFQKEQAIKDQQIAKQRELEKQQAAQKRAAEESNKQRIFGEINARKQKTESDMTAAGEPYWKVKEKLDQIDVEFALAWQNNAIKKASGGIVPGVGSGDIVPAMLEPGELVVPKKHVQKFANGGMVGGIQGFANGGMAQGGPELLDVAARFNQAATQISQGLSGFSTSVSTFNGAVANFGTFVDKFDEAVGKIPGQIELSGANEISVNLMGQDSIVKAVTEAIGPMIAQAIRDNQPVEQRAQ